MPGPQAGPEQRDGRQTQAARQGPSPQVALKRQARGQRGLQRQATSRNQRAAGVRQARAQGQVPQIEGPAQVLRDEEPT